MANYSSIHTGQQIDSAVDAALNPESTPTANSGALVTSGGVAAAISAEAAERVSGLATKQNALTFDNEPIQNSNNPVKSNGIWAWFQSVQSLLTFDNTPTAGSDNPVKSKGIKSAIDNAISTLQSSLTSLIGTKAPINSPSLTGNPTAPTQTQTDDSTKLATTAFVQDAKDAVNDNIADEYNPSDTYGEDDFVIHDQLLYKFLSEAEHLVYRTIDGNVYRDADGKIYRAAPIIVWDGGDVVQTALANEVTKLLHRVPIAPSADGTYTLTCTVTSGVPSYGWIASN